MDDRELLEWAAKAAGIASDGLGGCYDMEREREWNPLTDDGDALRLAVKLEMRINTNPYQADVIFCENESSSPRTMWEPVSATVVKYAATRRAIVRAAAEIGKAMEYSINIKLT